jgi:hypothetical protein
MPDKPYRLPGIFLCLLMHSKKLTAHIKSGAPREHSQVFLFATNAPRCVRASYLIGPLAPVLHFVSHAPSVLPRRMQLLFLASHCLSLLWVFINNCTLKTGALVSNL